MARHARSPERLGEHEVEHDQVELVLLELLDRRLAVAYAHNPVALALEVGVPFVVEQGNHGVAFNGLALQQHLGHQVELVAAGGQDLLGALVGLAHDALHLDVDAARRLLGIILMIGIVATQEHLMLRLAEHLGAQLLAHAQARDHLARHLGCPAPDRCSRPT